MEKTIFSIFGWLIGLLIAGGMFTWFVALLRRPLRMRNEAEIILDLIESADREGKAIEREFVELARQNDRSLGPHFHVFTSWLGQGHPLAEAIRRTPNLMPDPIRHMLIHGLENDSLKLVFPCCRQRLDEADNRWRTAMGVITGSGCGTVIIALPLFLFIWLFTLPKFNAIAEDMMGNRLNEMAPLLGTMQNGNLLIAFGVVYSLILLNVWLFSGLSPARGMFPWLELLGRRLSSLRNRLPWLRLRLERDLSTLLAGFIDAGMPAEAALAHAGKAVGDSRIQSRAEAARRMLGEGCPLEQALARVSPDKQFAWHLRNAGKAKSGFTETLRVWHETLSARAAFKETAAAQVSTTLLIISTGALVGYVCTAIFQFLSVSIEKLAGIW
jgi:type II secretory pathway component PulF